MKFYFGPSDGAPWDKVRWPNFSLHDISCKCCGEVWLGEGEVDCLQRMRNNLGGPLVVTCGHRCEKHNRDIGGAKHSVHLQLAFDLALNGYNRKEFLNAAELAGFTRFGLMRYGMHVDCHEVDASHAKMWTYGPESRRLWAGLFPKNTPDIGG